MKTLLVLIIAAYLYCSSHPGALGAALHALPHLVALGTAALGHPCSAHLSALGSHWHGPPLSSHWN